MSKINLEPIAGQMSLRRQAGICSSMAKQGRVFGFFACLLTWGCGNSSQVDKTDFAIQQVPIVISDSLNLNDAYFLGQKHGKGGVAAGDAFGGALASGDLNADGLADLVVGTPGNEGNKGVIFLFGGTAGGLHTGKAFKEVDAGESANAAAARLGWSLVIGDFNGDGLADVVAGAPGHPKSSATHVGKVFVWYGRAQETQNWEADGTGFFSSDVNCGSDEAGDEFGFALAAGDFNGDGVDDLAIGAPGENSTAGQNAFGTANGVGMVCVLPGISNVGIHSSQGSAYFQDRYFTEDRALGDRFGHALATARLTNGTHADLAIGAPGENAAAGSVSVWFGKSGSSSANFFSGGQNIRQENGGGTSSAGDRFGAALAADFLHGNLNANADLVVGAPGEVQGGLRSGAFFVFPGGTTNIEAGTWLDQLDVSSGGNQAGDEFGGAFATGDFNQDGFVDLAVGAPGKTPAGGGTGAGQVSLFRGSATGVETGNSLRQTALQGIDEAGDRFAAALGSGDFNGDGAADLAIGVPAKSPFGDPRGGLTYLVPGKSTNPELTLGPALGHITSTSVRVWVRSNRAALFRVEYWKPCTANCPAHFLSDSVQLTNAEDRTGIVILSGLEIGTSYSYIVKLAEIGSSTYRNASTETRFSTLASTPGKLRFAVGADINEFEAPFKIFNAIQQPKFASAFFLSIGDQMYSDSGYNTVGEFEGFYRRNWADPNFRSFMGQTPLFLTWDDHEIINDYDPGVPAHQARYAHALTAYKEYQNKLNPSTSGNLYYSFSARNVGFFVLDTRTFRDRTQNPPTMLGSVQRAALQNWLLSTSTKFKFIVSSVPFNDYATTGADTWNGIRPSDINNVNCARVGAFVDERDLIFNFIKANNIDNVVLLSGDQHWAGVFKLPSANPYKLYEFVPTPLGVENRIVPNCGLSTDPNVLQVATGGEFFGIFNIDTGVSPATLNYALVDATGSTRHQVQLNDTNIGL